MIKIICFDNFSERFISFMKQKVESNFKEECIFEIRKNGLNFAYDKIRKQYFADPVLLYLKLSNIEGEKIIGVTDKDIFTFGFNFIFGKAELNGKFGIVSTFRLASSREKKFFERVAKEINHELGHTFGLVHCENNKCVMNFSNTVEDTDIKNYFFCSICRGKYEFRL